MTDLAKAVWLFVATVAVGAIMIALLQVGWNYGVREFAQAAGASVSKVGFGDTAAVVLFAVVLRRFLSVQVKVHSRRG